MRMPNLLPWRRERRIQRLRFWGLLYAASLLLMLAGGVSLCLTQSLASQALQSDLAGTRAVQKVLKARQPQPAKASSPSQPPEPVAWQPVLESLASAMPQQAWLTTLRYQPPSLILSGYATSFTALTAMTDALKRVTGFIPGPAGALQQDSRGRWMFTFQLHSRR
ncbi:PilN domain-containing protein [Enterobacter pasteurii]|uniref:PilN domain-containing protein n=1 Tax=Enterobacter pasteurii TaxID=3029761 RepID=UPI0011DD713F|nr:PilN domain-containing protein [Enterobacter pasteurii]QLA68856.1 PilN domain-containing protein [Enterobacter pasteurii]